MRVCAVEEVVAQTRTAATGVIPPGAVGQPATTRSAGVAGWSKSDDRGTESGDRARGREVSGGAATDDAHPGVGALTALAFVLIIGQADRFECGKQIAS